MNPEQKKQDYSMAIIISLLVGIIIVLVMAFHSLYEECYKERISRSKMNDCIDDMNRIIYQDNDALSERVTRLEGLMINPRRR
jgi:hypothetical protein